MASQIGEGSRHTSMVNASEYTGERKISLSCKGTRKSYLLTDKDED